MNTVKTSTIPQITTIILKRDIENLIKNIYLKNVVKKSSENPPITNEVLTSSQNRDPEGNKIDYMVLIIYGGPATSGISCHACKRYARTVHSTQNAHKG